MENYIKLNNNTYTSENELKIFLNIYCKNKNYNLREYESETRHTELYYPLIYNYK